jgi:hypothetical protein
MGPTVVSLRLIVGAKQALDIPRSAQLGAGLGIINHGRVGTPACGDGMSPPLVSDMELQGGMSTGHPGCRVEKDTTS